MFFVALLAGAKAVSQTNLTLGVDLALCQAFGLPGCADQSVIAAPLSLPTEADVAALQTALAETFGRYSQACRQDLAKALLILDVDLSPLPASRQAEGSERGYMGAAAPKPGANLCGCGRPSLKKRCERPLCLGAWRRACRCSRRPSPTPNVCWDWQGRMRPLR